MRELWQSSIRVGFAGLFGATFGLLVYLLSMLVSSTFASPQNLAPENLFLAINSIIFAGTFWQLAALGVGALLGIAITHSRQTALTVTTTILGALCGLVVYVVGFIVGDYTSGGAGASLYSVAAQALYTFTYAGTFSILLGGLIGFLIAKNVWKFTGVLMYISLVSIVLGYLVYSFTTTLPLVPGAYKLLSMVLFVAESASLIMVAIYAFYALDVYVKVGWRRTPSMVPFSQYYMPKVAFHVPCYNEPPSLVIDTLKTMLKVDYPKDRYTIMIIDDSTKKSSWEPLRKFCQENGVLYLRRSQRKGFKAGALNYALRKTPDDTDLVAIVDADYQIEPNYLKEVVSYFIDPKIAFIQTPQDYRNISENYLTEQYYYADSYFYRAILPSRNEANAIIFAGTMGIIRKDVLLQVGGWGEQFICEDAEISVRILNAGYESLYINKTYGRGLIPHTYDGYKKQLYRWSFGGVKILQAHMGKFLFSGQMSPRQRFDFFVGGLHWFDGIWIMIIATVIATLALADIFSLPVMTYHQKEVLLIGLVPIFLMVDGIIRLHMALRKSMDLSMWGTFRVMGMWFSIKFNNMFAAFMALFGVNKPFIRTSKKPVEKLSFFQAVDRSLSITKFETACAVILMALATMTSAKTYIFYTITGDIEFTRLLLAFWLLFYSLIFLCAPLYAYRSYRSPATQTTRAAHMPVKEMKDSNVVRNGV